MARGFGCSLLFFGILGLLAGLGWVLLAWLSGAWDNSGWAKDVVSGAIIASISLLVVILGGVLAYRPEKKEHP